MKTKIKQKRLNKLIKKMAILLSVFLLIGLIFIFLEKIHITNFISYQISKESTDIPVVVDNNPPTDEQKNAGNIQKETQNGAITNNDLEITITSIDTSNNLVKIRSAISGVISNSGICTLNLSKGDIIVSKTSGTYAMPSLSTCKGFDINKSDLSSGVWDVKLIVNIDGKESSITNKFSLE